MNKYFKNPNSGDVFAFPADGSEDEFIPDGLVLMSSAEVAAHLSPPMQSEALEKRVARAVDAKLDQLAISWQYRDYVSARSYVGDVNPKYAAEGAAIAAYGSQCWTVLDDLAADVLAGQADMPASVDEVLALLPVEPSRPIV